MHPYTSCSFMDYTTAAWMGLEFSQTNRTLLPRRCLPLLTVLFTACHSNTIYIYIPHYIPYTGFLPLTLALPATPPALPASNTSYSSGLIPAGCTLTTPAGCTPLPACLPAPVLPAWVHLGLGSGLLHYLPALLFLTPLHSFYTLLPAYLPALASFLHLQLPPAADDVPVPTIPRPRS